MPRLQIGHVAEVTLTARQPQLNPWRLAVFDLSCVKYDAATWAVFLSIAILGFGVDLLIESRQCAALVDQLAAARNRARLNQRASTAVLAAPPST